MRRRGRALCARRGRARYFFHRVTVGFYRFTAYLEVGFLNYVLPLSAFLFDLALLTLFV